tara:strand:- start:977 stop:1951 length:975 start_codon:yes stop_codon:yes gene_type:complete
MNNDKGFVDAYQSIYEHHQKDENGNTIPHEGEQINEAVVTGSLLAAKAGLSALKGAKAMAGLGKAAKVASKVGQVAQGVGAVRDAAAPRGKGQMNPQNEAVMAMGAMNAVKKVGSAVGGAAKSVGGAVKDVAMQAAKKAPVTKTTVIKAHREVDLHDAEGNLTHQITDVVTPEPLGERDEDMATRLWDEVVANLTTLGEMAGVRYQVTPLEEKKSLDPVGKEDGDVDNDGDVDDSDSYLKKRRDAIGKAMGKKGKKDDEDKDEDKEEKKSEKKETKEEYTPKFSVRSQVAFSTPEEVVEEGISDEQFNAFAPSIAEAHRKIYRD